MDSSYTDGDEDDELVPPLAARLAKKMKQRNSSKTLPEDEQVPFEGTKIEKKRDLKLSPEESLTEPQKKKVKQDSDFIVRGMAESLDDPESESHSGPGVLSSAGNLCGSPVHQNHLHCELKENDIKNGKSLGKRAPASYVENQHKLSSSEKSLTNIVKDGPQSMSIALNEREPPLSNINVSTTDKSRTEADSSSDKKLKKEFKLTNGIKDKGGEKDETEQIAKNSEDSTFSVRNLYIRSTETKVRCVNEDHTRAKERHELDSTWNESGTEDTSLSPPFRPSKGKQLVTKNGKVKSKGKGTHERDSHSSRDERSCDEAKRRKDVNGDVVNDSGSHGDQSDGDISGSPVFNRSKHLKDPLHGRRANARNINERPSSESEIRERHSRHRSREKLNLERKYPRNPTSPKSSKSRQIHADSSSSHGHHNKLSPNHSRDVGNSSHGSHHRYGGVYVRDKESLSCHQANKDGERVQDTEHEHNTLNFSPSSSRNDKKPTSSPRYNKFLQNQKSPKSRNDNPSRSSKGGHDSSMSPSKHYKVDKHHKRHGSRECNLSSTEGVISSVRSPRIWINTQFKKSHRSRGERDKRPHSEVSETSFTSSSHRRGSRKHSLRSRDDKSENFSQGVRSSCRYASGTSEVSVVQDRTTTSQNDSRGYDMGGIDTPKDSLDEIYVHDITSPDIFSDEDGFIEEVDVITSGIGPRRRGSSHGTHQSVTEVVDDDDSVILLDDEMGRNSTPPDRRGRESGLSVDEGGSITPGTAAAINQLEADEAMARRLQLEFDREEAYVRTPPQPEELGMAESFHLGEGQFTRRVVHSYIPELYSSVMTFDMGQGMMPWVHSTVETSSRSRNHRGRGHGRGRRPHVHIEHLYHQAEDDYERLLELEEQLGPAVSHGLPPEILTQLPTFKFQGDSNKQTKDDECSCTICMADYQINEDLRRLPCFHAYHRDCIDRWFQNSSACPVCRVRVELG